MQDTALYNKKVFTTHLLPLLLIGVLGFLAYSNTFQVPFQWDGEIFIKENPIIKDLGYFLDASEAKGSEFYGALKSRYIGFLSFALNYKIGALNVTGYHLVNIAIHILNAFLVYAFIILTFRTPFLKKTALAEQAGYVALFSALIFTVHPIQTEAVTYIFQRLAALVSLFYLLSIVSYVRARLSEGPAAVGLYAVSLISAVLAMKTKENAFTLPVVITLYEFLFFNGPAGRRLIRLAPLLLTMCIIPLSLAAINRPAGELIGGIAPATRGFSGLSREVYLLTQFRVIVTYLRLLVLPVNQNLDYDYPVFRSFAEPEVFLSFFFLLAIAGISLYFLYRSFSANRGYRVIAFGIFWFFITISVESSIVPIHMVLDEYRMYLPSAGLLFALISFCFLVLQSLGTRKTGMLLPLILFSIALIFTFATYKRNMVWQTKISLWEDVVRKSPALVYARNNLGVAYLEADRLDDAVVQFNAAVALKPDHETAYNNLGMIYSRQGLLDKAEYAFRKAVSIKPDYAKAYNNLGVIYVRQGRFDDALNVFETAVSFKTVVVDAYNNLGILYMQKGLFREAEKALQDAMQISPDYAKAHYNMGLLYEQQGRINEALGEFKAALRLDPTYAKARAKLEEYAK